jgi:transcriptional regulator with XRE-family HTH domain
MKKLKMIRLLRGLTQQQVAIDLGISQCYLSMIESGRKPINEILKKRIRQYYRLKHDEYI